MASISEDQGQFSCPVCRDLLKDPVTVHCGHRFCTVCINGCWDQEDQRGVYSCPQCRETFTPRPVLHRNNVMAEMLGKLKKTEVRAASPAFTTHKLVKTSTHLQERICSQHGKLTEIYCRTDQSVICHLCTMGEHKGHDTVSAAAGRTQKQSELKEMQMKFQQRIQEKGRKLQEQKQAVDTLKCSAQAAVEDSERIFTDLIHTIEKMRSEITELIRVQENVELGQAEGLLDKLEQEIVDLKRRQTELEQLSHTEDDMHFLQSFQSLCVSSGSEDSPITAVSQHLSSEELRKHLSDLKERLEEFCEEEFSKIPSPVAAEEPILLSEPKTREDFLKYYRKLTLDPNTVNHELCLYEKNRVVRWRGIVQRHPDHPDRFDFKPQVLCKEGVCGRCYWEVEWNTEEYERVSISVSYKGISRKGWGNESSFGCNDQSWNLECRPAHYFWHYNNGKELTGPSSSRIGVYVDHSAGTLSFYRVSDTMTLLHTVHTTFTHPLYAGFGIGSTDMFHNDGVYVKLCKLK